MKMVRRRGSPIGRMVAEGKLLEHYSMDRGRWQRDYLVELEEMDLAEKQYVTRVKQRMVRMRARSVDIAEGSAYTVRRDGV